METLASVVARTAAPADRPRDALDVRTFGPPDPLPRPPDPLYRTLERLVDMPDETVLIQCNDRAPQSCYPKLEDRGYSYETPNSRTRS